MSGIPGISGLSGKGGATKKGAPTFPTNPTSPKLTPTIPDSKVYPHPVSFTEKAPPAAGHKKTAHKEQFFISTITVLPA